MRYALIGTLFLGPIGAIAGWFGGLVKDARNVPTPATYALAGSAVFGLSAAFAGLIIGLLAYPPTAAFAVLELGVPAAFLGALTGSIAGLGVVGVRAARRSWRRTTP